MSLVVETWPINRLIPYARNPRRNDEQVDRMCGAIREFGFRIPVVAKSDGTVVDGHLRLKAARKLGLTEVPVALADELTDAQVKAFRILANQSANWADWDTELLKLELDDLQAVGFDMELVGFDEEELASLVQAEEVPPHDPDDVPETKVDVCTVLGDVWVLGDHRLICGSATEDGDLAKLMGDDRADMVFTDPPYNVNYSDKNRFLNTIGRPNCIQEPIQGDAHKSDEEIAEELWGPAFANMRAFAAPHCSIYVTAPQGGAHGVMMMMMMMRYWTLKHELVWVKNVAVLGRADYNYRHEPIFYGWADKHVFYGEGEFLTSVWEVPKPQKNDLHPTMKPTRLIENALRNSSKKGDIVLDVFGGSGSTLIACEETGRRARLVELEPHYCDVIVRRWQGVTGGRAVHAETGEEFGE